MRIVLGRFDIAKSVPIVHGGIVERTEAAPSASRVTKLLKENSFLSNEPASKNGRSAEVDCVSIVSELRHIL